MIQKGHFSITKLNGRMVTVGYHKFYPGEINDTKLQAPKGVSTFSPSHRHNLRHNAGPEFANRDFFEERAPWIDVFTYYALQQFYSNFIPIEIRPERMGAPKCRVPSLPPTKWYGDTYKMGAPMGVAAYKMVAPGYPTCPPTSSILG